MCVWNPSVSELFFVCVLLKHQNEGSDEVWLPLGVIPEWFHHQTSHVSLKRIKKTTAVLKDFNLNVTKAFSRFSGHVFNIRVHFVKAVCAIN